NTYGANRAKLSAYGMEDKIRERNAVGVRLARDAAAERAFVAGAIGPLGIRIEPYGPTSIDEARAIFREQAEALVEGGVDLLVLETFSDVAEIHQALEPVPSSFDLPSPAPLTV